MQRRRQRVSGLTTIVPDDEKKGPQKGLVSSQGDTDVFKAKGRDIAAWFILCKMLSSTEGFGLLLSRESQQMSKRVASTRTFLDRVDKGVTPNEQLDQSPGVKQDISLVLRLC